MAAILKPAGDTTAGVQVKGATKNYQLDGVNDATSGTESIGPYDSGNILGTVPPGQAGIKLVSGVQQRSEAAILCDGTAGVTGNALLSSTGTGLVPTVNVAQLDSSGLSLAPQTE